MKTATMTDQSASAAAPPARFVKTSFANNEKGVLASLAEFALPPAAPRHEVLAFTSDAATTSQIADVNDDLKRELAFYNQALATVVQARKVILSAGIPFSRPEDYFAEMVKSDAHMAKIRSKLIEDQAKMKKSEEAKRQRDMKKYGKQVQAEVLKERKQKEKALSEKVNEVKKKRKLEQLKDGAGDGGEFEDDLDVAIMSSDDERPSKKRAKKGGEKKPLPNKKRQVKNQKYGFGGKKKGSKKNTAESSADFMGLGRKSKSPAGKKAPAKRPGKSARMASKGRK
ncbi:eukaryotic rRNA processing [Catenaria anguillulae PL171]|uniref:Eukaryotic rRNA processing n=1 Tax=Catenaria anguillulae PL171 TaxID=765915 RepID=A0A1Y2HM18_9FUNG|nr:eukaryotic rRNA processing [Catenaria anguillulae PL171]